MRYENIRDGAMALPTDHLPNRRLKLGALLKYDLPTVLRSDNDDETNHNNKNITSSSPTNSSSVTSTPRNSNSSGTPSSDHASSSPRTTGSPYAGGQLFSPWNVNSAHHPLSPYMKSPWIIPSPALFPNDGTGSGDSLIGSIVRQEGHVYSLAASGDLLYTGSESKNIRVWKNRKEFAGFKSNSGLVKAIILHGDKIFTGHQDGKIRVWKVSSRSPGAYRRIGSLPTLKDSLKSSVNPKNYVEVRRRKNVLKIKHYDAVSCLALNADLGLLYSGSWDKTLKVWRIGNYNHDNNNNTTINSSDYKCVESINAHDDAINAVATGFDSLVFTGSADGTVKVWKRELEGRGSVKHFLVQTLLNQDSAVTALAVSDESAVVYCGSSDGLVNFWEGEKQLSHGGALRGHKLAVLCLATAGSLVFSGSADKTICVWRRELSGGDHVCLSVLTGHSGPVKCLAVEEEEEDDARDAGGESDQRWILYSGSLDRSVKIWRVDDHAPEWREYHHHSPRNSYYSNNCYGGYDYHSPSPPTPADKKRQ
ncbi:unnamed protein product [Linum trigynum]|uniref:Uncharacterized protein n=1 Tax=Linum trigynum TaxID=586398 RepID=A0AAV2EUB2_9ROSI